MSITITEVRNAASLQSDNLAMEVEINHPDYGWIPYFLDPNDEDSTIDNDELMDLIGTNFEAYVAPTSEELTTEAAAAGRFERDTNLRKFVDPMVSNALRWAELTSSKQTEWTTYRTALLDVTEQSGFPHNISWPTPPE